MLSEDPLTQIRIFILQSLNTADEIGLRAVYPVDHIHKVQVVLPGDKHT